MNIPLEFIKGCREIIGDDYVLTSPEDLAVYSFDATYADHRPDLILLPDTIEQVSQIVKLAVEHKIPLITRGMGSGMAAATVPFKGGVVMALTRMNRILEIDQENRTILVEVGVITAELQYAVEKLGLFYPPDPGSIRHSTIGGNISTNAGGPRCLKYGVTGNYVLGLTVVTGTGEIMEIGKKLIKDVVGYNLKALFTGSEGTLGVITQALLKLVAKPAAARTAVADFIRLEDASRTVNAILTAGVLPAAIELLDESTIQCLESVEHLGLPMDVEAMLIIETDGSDPEIVQREIEAAGEICRQNGARVVTVARDEEERARLWHARRSVSSALARVAPAKLGEDITVPRSAIPEAVRRIKALSQEYGLPVVVFGHAGDGNLHPNVMFDPRVGGEWETAKKMASRIFHIAMDLGGTLSGEHGIGMLKRPYMEQALGSQSIEYQRQIKRIFDPHNILNPGKVFPE